VRVFCELGYLTNTFLAQLLCTTDPLTNFAMGITNTYAEQSLIANGVGLDKCWRNMNQKRAPVTLLTTINDNERMLPGMLSAC